MMLSIMVVKDMVKGKGVLGGGFAQCYREAVGIVERACEGYLGRDESVPDRLVESILYSIRGGGKRLRPVLVLLSCRACGGQDETSLPAAAAMEMIHTFSLIHDDLPAMDDDDLRRGQPTNHKVFGDGMAVLAGDALMTCAFGTIAKYVEDDRLAKRLVLELSEATGGAGMIGGQAVDILGEGRGGQLEEVRRIHTLKTGKLFRAAARMGGLCAGASESLVEHLGWFGLKCGLAFQVVDDLLDITGTEEELGKEAQKDKAAGKLTYPSVVGEAASREHVKVLIGEAIGHLAELGQRGEPLREFTQMVAERKK